MIAEVRFCTLSARSYIIYQQFFYVYVVNSDVATGIETKLIHQWFILLFTSTFKDCKMFLASELNR